MIATAPTTTTSCRVHTLHPGDVVCARRGDRLDTLLGSCVAILLNATTAARQTTCHASPALDMMYRLLRKEGFAPQLCKAYVYGGGNMFPALSSKSHVGDVNASWAMEALAYDGVEVIEHDLGGNAYRRVAWTIGSVKPQVVAVKVN
jgi:chemotaxis protein CheD